MATQVKIVLSAQDKTAAAFKTAAGNINALKGSAASLVSGLGGLAGIGAGLSVAGLVSFTKAAIDSLDALNDVSDATGASIENISALEDVAARTGTQMDTVTTALIKLNQTLNAAKPDSPQAKAIEAIGLSVEELKRLDPAEALLKIAVAMDGFANDGNKARLAQELFGKSLREVAPLLNDLAEKGKLVATVTTEQAKEAEKLNKEFSALQKNLTDLARDMAGPVVSSLNLLIQKLQEGAKAGNGFWAVMGQSFMEDVRDWADMPNSAAQYAQRLGEISEKLKDTNLHETRRVSLLREQTSLQTKLAAFPNFSPDNESRAETARLNRKPSIGGLPGTAGKPRSGGGGGAAKDPYAESKRYLDNLQKQLEKTQELSAVQQLGYDLNAGRVGKLTAAQQNELVNIALKIDGIKAETQAEKDLADEREENNKAEKAFFADVERMTNAKQAQIDALMGATPTAKLAQQRADVQLLTTEFENGRISEQLYLEAVTERLDLTAEKLDKTKSLTEELGLTFTSAFEDAIAGGQAFSDILKGLEQDIMRIVTRKLITEPLGNAISGFASSFDFGSLLSFDGGGSTGGGARSGGLDGRGGFLSMLHPQETVIDHTKGQRVAGGNTVNVTVNQSFAPGTSRATTLQAAADASRQLSYAGRNL